MKTKDYKLMKRVAEIIETLCEGMNIKHDTRMTTMMDLDVANSQFNMDWQAMIDGNTQDLIHDIGGIKANINRETGKIENCFLPRHTKAA